MNGNTTSVVRNILISLAIVAFGAFLLVMAWNIKALDDTVTYHLVKVEERGELHYAIQACISKDCKLYGYRWPITDDGLKLAEETYHYFANPHPEQKIIAVVE